MFTGATVVVYPAAACDLEERYILNIRNHEVDCTYFLGKTMHKISSSTRGSFCLKLFLILRWSPNFTKVIKKMYIQKIQVQRFTLTFLS